MNKKIIVGIVMVVLLAGSFYGGTVYAKSSMPARGQFGNGQSMGNGAGIGGTRAGMGGGFTAGEIISKDATGITIKMQNGSTKIVLMSDSTQVMKSTIGIADDLTTGTTVTVTGSANSDGSVSAQSVQIRLAGLVPTTAPTGR